ncbi:kelch-like protein 10 [Neosynchiropus ocellatus]
MSSSLYNEYRQQRVFCDAIIRVNNVEFPVHKIVLCNCSPYFRSLFERWSVTGHDEFVINGLCPESMQCIVEFAYTGYVPVTKDNVQTLLRAADYVSIAEIKDSCYKFLADHLCVENCIGVWKLTKSLQSSGIQQKSFDFILAHFEELPSCKEFTELTLQELSEILVRDDLNIREESTAFQAAVHWVSLDPEQRRKDITELLCKVRLSLLTPDYIRTKVATNEFVKNEISCLNLVTQMISSEPRIQTLIAYPRLPTSILLAIGGMNNGNATKRIEAYDVRDNRWVTLSTSLQYPCANHGVVFLDGSIYCIGGVNGEEFLNSVRRLDLKTNTWHEVAPMHRRRSHVSVTVLNGYIYALGGSNSNIRLRTAECYKPEENQWGFIAHMCHIRSHASCAALNNKIYICGGYNGANSLRTAECYNPETNQWTMISPMLCRRSGIGVVVHRNRIYAVGGFNGQRYLCSAEVYHPGSNSWTFVSSMHTPRTNFGLAVVEEHLISVGGYNGRKAISEVEHYNAKLNLWHKASNMSLVRRALSCCVVSGFPNMAMSLFPRDSQVNESVMEGDDL